MSRRDDKWPPEPQALDDMWRDLQDTNAAEAADPTLWDPVYTRHIYDKWPTADQPITGVTVTRLAPERVRELPAIPLGVRLLRAENKEGGK